MSIRVPVSVSILVGTLAIISNTLQQGFANWPNAMLAVILACCVWSIFRVQRELTCLRTAEEHSQKTLSQVILAVSDIGKVGNKNSFENLNGIADETIRETLNAAHKKMLALRQEEEENNWLTKAVAAVSELKQKGNDLTSYSVDALLAIVKQVNASYGKFFLLRREGNDEWLEATASYAANQKTENSMRIMPGDGLLGQVYFDKKIVVLNDLPESYIKVTSGLGESPPRCIGIIPLTWEGILQGAIEIASFQPIRPLEIAYLGKAAESIGFNIASLAKSSQTQELLEESRKMAEELKNKEEEMRQNLEELRVVQELMKRKERELEAVVSSMSTVELDLSGQVMGANAVFLAVTGYTLTDIQGRPYKNLIPEQGNDHVQYNMMWSSILAGRSFSGEFRIRNKQKKDMWMAGNFTPLANESGELYKVMVISLFTTQDKEKQAELQQLVGAFKSCFPIAEVNPDLTFKSANDLFLSVLGIGRVELKKTLPSQILSNSSMEKIKTFLSTDTDGVEQSELSICHKNGTTRSFNASLAKVGSAQAAQHKGLLILRHAV